MGCKFRLSVHRKNEERKKKAECANAEDSYQQHDQAEGNQCSSPPELNGIQVAMEVKLPNPMWHRHVHQSSYVHFSKIASTHSSTSFSQPSLITRCVKVRDNRSWVVFIHSHKLDAQNCGALSIIPQCVDSTTLV